MGYARALLGGGFFVFAVFSANTLFASSSSSSTYDDGIRVSVPGLAGLCNEGVGEHVQDTLASLPLDIVFLHFFGPLGDSLPSNYSCQTALIDLVKGRKEAYIATLREVVKDPKGYGSLLQRLLFEGGHHLDAKSFFSIIDAALKEDNPSLAKSLSDIMVEASKERPVELPAAINEAILRRETGIVIRLWNAAAADDRTEELLATILDSGTKSMQDDLVEAFANSLGDYYEQSYVLSLRAKRNVTGLLLSNKLAKDIFLAYIKGLKDDDFDKAEEQGARWQADLALVLREFVRDESNPYFSKGHLTMLGKHLIKHVEKLAPAVVTSQQLRDECQQWKEHFRRYNIPVFMKT